MKVICNKCQREFDPNNLDEVMYHEVHTPIIATVSTGEKVWISDEMRGFFKDIRFALLGMVIGAILNSVAVNIYQGIAAFCSGTALVMFLRLLVHKWVVQAEIRNNQMAKELAQALLRKNEVARKLGWPTT